LEKKALALRGLKDYRVIHSAHKAESFDLTGTSPSDQKILPFSLCDLGERCFHLFVLEGVRFALCGCWFSKDAMRSALCAMRLWGTLET
jgi:hypothetical protein